MSKVLDFLNGKKSYIIAVVVVLTAGAQAFGITIPDWVYTLEAAAGLGAVRVAINKSDAA